MQIRFEITIDDLVAFNRFHFRHSPAMRRQRFLLTWMIPIIIVCAATWHSVADGTYELWAFCMLFAVIYVLVFRRSVVSGFERQARRMYMEGKNRGTLGWHELELTGSTLLERNEVGESTIRIDAIEKVASDDDHTFVYVGAVMAHVIPRASVTDGDYDSFVSTLRTKCGDPQWRSD